MWAHRLRDMDAISMPHEDLHLGARLLRVAPHLVEDNVVPGLDRSRKKELLRDEARLPVDQRRAAWGIFGKEGLHIVGVHDREVLAWEDAGSSGTTTLDFPEPGRPRSMTATGSVSLALALGFSISATSL